ncbi:MAG: ParB N-terminal domain-containing protein, partial [Clostridia bacterium]|nr:ParB N-terminal domain-containing protein [Clostridia bacterium]
MNLVKMDLDSLIIPEWYAKMESEPRIAKLKTAIGTFGYIVPIVVNTVNNHVVSGVKRLEAMRDLGFEEAEVVTVSIRVMQNEQTCSVMLDKIDFEWDPEKLKTLLNMIDETQVDFLKLTGFSEAELKALELKSHSKVLEDGAHRIIRPPYESKPQHRFDIVPGSLFRLGNHRLMCGDATSSEMAAYLMGGQKADLVFTDPPYDLNESLYNHVLDENLENGHVFIMNDDVNTVRYLKNSTFKFEEFFVADFGFAALVNNRANLQHILVSHETKGEPFRPDISSDDFNSIIKMKYRGTLDDDRTGHFHQKSIAFIQLFIEKYAVRNVLDIFGGSGSTLIACERSGKNCFMMEMEPSYCQMIIDRWEAATGKQAESMAGLQT